MIDEGVIAMNTTKLAKRIIEDMDAQLREALDPPQPIPLKLNRTQKRAAQRRAAKANKKPMS